VNRRGSNSSLNTGNTKTTKDYASVTYAERARAFRTRFHSLPFFVPRSLTCDNGSDEDSSEKKTFELGFLQRIFVAFDDPISCQFAVLNSIVMIIVIILSCVVYVMATCPGLKHRPSNCKHPACDNDPNYCPNSVICEPEEDVSLVILDIICLALFTLDYLVRILLVPLMPTRLAKVLPKHLDPSLSKTDSAPDPVYPWYKTLYLYASKPLNIIDLVAILPSYVSFAVDSGPSVSIVRIFRLARVFRVFKIGGMNTGVPLFTKTVTRALPAVRVMFFFSGLAVICVGSVIYYLESGTFTVNADYPDGEYIRWDEFHSTKVVSPFKSILHACYWAVVTTTTVGYGDFYPTSPLGRLFAVIFMYFGIVLLALPISVVGASFQREYERLHPQEEEETSQTPIIIRRSASGEDGDIIGTELLTIRNKKEHQELEKSLKEINEKVTFLCNAMASLQERQQKLEEREREQSYNPIHSSK